MSCQLAWARRKRKVADLAGPEPNAHEEIDENYWAQAAAERTEGADGLAELGELGRVHGAGTRAKLTLIL